MVAFLSMDKQYDIDHGNSRVIELSTIHFILYMKLTILDARAPPRDGSDDLKYVSHEATGYCVELAKLFCQGELASRDETHLGCGA